ncbi:hypothetical protein KM043_009840 [Ampulex compressa]|nr:hypothetical protein KM043_009840 [Ampulex compressa]
MCTDLLQFHEEDKDQICVGQCTGSRVAPKQLLVDPVEHGRESSSVIVDPDARHVATFCVSTTGKTPKSGPLNGGSESTAREERDAGKTRR